MAVGDLAEGKVALAAAAAGGNKERECFRERGGEPGDLVHLGDVERGEG